ncbi:MAG: hypothetical protein K9W46_00190 [Candidatus Heimdallarchaeum endolithica]|uniref:Uncharacterized protein n=1 Tax=Candidatus Heimdallarchaeum endolithica TaxID=2876572 RepID=A0A9Y1FNY0_9ARCH|nr:MAG: hypothetical protein K9W46_00190 [Candidatus Heimdallarchaeum endolithica]
MSSQSEFWDDERKIREAFNVSNFICPMKGINYPCVVCKECQKMELKQYFLENGLIEKTKNSSLISLIIEIKDPFDDMLLKRICKTLFKETGIVMSEPEPGFSVTFFITPALLEKVESKEDLIKFIKDFPHTFLTETISAKSALNKWERVTAKRLAWNMGVR